MPDRNKVLRSAMQPFLRALIEDYQGSRNGNARLLTGMVVALTAGPLLPSWSTWEAHKWSLQRLRRHGPQRPPSWRRSAGRPLVTEIESNGRKVRIGTTEFRPDYVPRAEMIAERKRARKVRAQGLVPLLTMRGV
jgi:hypothetical protein